MRTTKTVDCEGVQSEQEFWQRYLEAIQPVDAEQFGKNLDALWDALEGGGPGSPGDIDLHFSNSSALAGLRGGAFLDALRKIAAEVSALRVMLD